jgi:hypothetical protein
MDASCFSIKQILCIVKPKSKGITETRGVSHCGLAIYIKTYLNAKEELQKLKYFTMQKYNLQKSSKRNQKSFKIL